MPLWLQNLLVLLAVIACVAYIAVNARRALQGRKSGLNACGSCKSCAPSPDGAKPAASNRIAFLPAEMLIKRK
jgi:hypothetical protein